MKDFSRLAPLICGFLVVIDNVFFVTARKCCDDARGYTVSARSRTPRATNECDLLSKHLVPFCSLLKVMFFLVLQTSQDLSFSISIFDHHLPTKHKEFRDCLSFSSPNTHSQSPLNDCWPKASVTHEMSISRRIQMAFFASPNRCVAIVELFDNYAITCA